MKGNMIRFRLNTADGDVVVSLDSEQPKKFAPIEYEGPRRGVLLAKRWLSNETGAVGAAIGDWATPEELKAAMRSPKAKVFGPTVLEETTRSAGGPKESEG